MSHGTKRSKVQISWEMVTPAMAKKWLAHNTHNRHLFKPWASQLARDMTSGKWRTTHEGIAFGPNGILLDGQHRLQAVVESGKTIKMLVCRGLDVGSQLVCGGGKKRKAFEQITLGGSIGSVDTADEATARSMLRGYGSATKPTAQELEDFIGRHREAIQFAKVNIHRRRMIPGISTGAVRAVVARAWYSAEIPTLMHFCDVLTGGEPRTGDGVITLLWRAIIIENNQPRRTFSHKDRYAKTERALHAYLQGEKLTKLYPATKELFPLVGDTDAAPALAAAQ